VFALAFRTGKTSRDVNPSMRGYKSSMSVPVWNSEWSRSAACRDTDPDLLFVQGAALLMNARKDYDRLDPVAFVRGA
jgi:hypothetical protein